MLARATLLGVLALPATLHAQSATDAAPTAAAAALVTVPALTPVYVRLEDEISSKTNKQGDRFRITVFEDVRVDGALVIPAGTPGEGQVVHAAKSGAGGKPGELILAARFLRLGDTEVRLRSFALGVAGADHSASALATSFVAGPFALFVKGGAVVVPRDTIGVAKTALEFRLPVAVSVPPAAEPTTPSTTRE